jgi:hypothetical protein
MTGGRHEQNRRSYGRERRISIRALQRDPVDLSKLSRVLLALAQADAEAKAQAEAESSSTERKRELADDSK